MLMVVGFNHNFSYKGVIYHIQTEDGGRNSPTIVTLLYHGGTILASRKTSYADISRVDNLAKVVEELMKEQHKGMLRSLKNGEFDAAIARFEGGGTPNREPVAAAAPLPATLAVDSPAPRPPASAPVAVPPAPVATSQVAPGQPVSPPPANSAAAAPKRLATSEASLDEIILAYLLGAEK